MSMYKKCTECQEEKNIYNFNRSKNVCKVCRAKLKKTIKRLSKIYPRPHTIICEICDEEAKNSKIVLDHCHISGYFRGYICNNCNVAIGMLKDNVNILKKAINYLAPVRKMHPNKFPQQLFLPFFEK